MKFKDTTSEAIKYKSLAIKKVIIINFKSLVYVKLMHFFPFEFRQETQVDSI